MIDERPDFTGAPRPSQKLILPGPDAAYSPPDQHTQRGNVQPEHGTYSRSMPIPAMPPVPTKKRNWRNDPAYIVLLVAICAVLIGGIAFAAIASTAFFSGTTQTITTPKTTIPPQGTVDTHPTFPTPGSNQGGTTGSKPNPTATPTMPVQPTATPTQTQSVQLTVQINDPPTQVSNNTIVPVSITTSTPNSTVRLVVIYSASPYFASIGPQITDENGNTTLSWPVAVRAFGHSKHVTARIMVVASDQNKESATSQTFHVQIVMQGIAPGQ